MDLCLLTLHEPHLDERLGTTIAGTANSAGDGLVPAHAKPEGVLFWDGSERRY